MNIGFYPGSFDPFTNGHLHVVKTASKLFDKVIIGIGNNSQKKRRFSKILMKEAIEKTIKNEHLKNVEIILYDSLSVKAALACNANFLIRGLRNDMDYSYEENLAQINEEIANIDTIYIRAGLLGFISSSMVTELLESGLDTQKYLPKDILDSIKS